MSDGAIRVWSTVGVCGTNKHLFGYFGNRRRHTDFMRAVVLIVGFAALALQAGSDLSTNTNAVSNLDSRHLVTNFDSFANDFVSDAEW